MAIHPWLHRCLTFLHLSLLICKVGTIMSASRNNVAKSGRVLKKWEGEIDKERAGDLAKPQRKLASAELSPHLLASH